MSKERELLKRIQKFLESDVENDFGIASDIKHILSQPEPEPVELEDIIKQIHHNAFYEGNSHIIGVRDVLTIFRNYLKSKRGVPKQEPLSDESICEILLKKEWKGFVDLIRKIEELHGIGVEG